MMVSPAGVSVVAPHGPEFPSPMRLRGVADTSPVSRAAIIPDWLLLQLAASEHASINANVATTRVCKQRKLKGLANLRRKASSAVKNAAANQLRAVC